MNSSKQKQESQKKHIFPIIFGVVLLTIVIFLLLFRLNDWPRSFWDEGWTLDAASNWIERGHLGHFLDGQPIPPRSPVRFPVVIPVAISMKIFGTGTWQGRLPGVLFTLLTLSLFIYLSSKLYSLRVGIAALIIALFLTPVDINPFYLGRTTLAEMPMIFYLFAGYALLWLAIEKHPSWGFGAMLVFGIAIHAKLQVPPFWLASMVMAIWMAAKREQKTTLRILVRVAIGSTIVSVIILIIQNIVMPGSLNDPAMIKILFNSAVAVFTVPIRKAALYGVLTYALPQCLGFIWAGRRIVGILLNHRSNLSNFVDREETNKEILCVSLWGLGASWMVWFLTMALMWSRYLFPPYFIGCIFFAAYLDSFTHGFDLRVFVRRTSDFMLKRNLSWLNLQAIIILLGFSILFGETIKSILYNLTTEFPNPAVAANYLNNNIPRGTTVESFESELYSLAKGINFHYPSDLVSMQYVRKWCIDPQLEIDYDPMQADPEYLVIGTYAEFWHPYDEVLDSGRFTLETEVGGYKIYHVNAPIPGN